MLFPEMSNEEFLKFLAISVANLGVIKRKTQLDLKRFYESLSGQNPYIPEGWVPFDDSAYDELLCSFSAALHKEARRRYLESI